MVPETSTLETFRKKLIELFPKRKDAIMNLLDAITANAHQARSIVQLSETPQFERQYSSITDAIADGLPHAKWQEIERLIYQSVTQNDEKKVNRFLLDCTGNPRPFARTLEDRTITHAPNPAPGNKPIVVGHQYSTLALLPDDAPSKSKHWIVPLSIQRVHSDEKGNEAGIKQVIQYIKDNALSTQLNIVAADSLYSSNNCRALASTEGSIVGIVRLNSTRNIYFFPEASASKRGRKKEYGERMKLNDPSTHKPCNEQTQTLWMHRKGHEYTVHIECWKDMLIRGSRDFQAAKHPFTLIRITIKNQQGKTVFKNPLWLAVTGKQRNNVSLIDAYNDYRSRYDIEHFFRFGKQKLLMRTYQTADVIHEELWWKLCALAYNQLHLGRNQVTTTLHRWEVYLPQYKGIDQKQPSLLTPSQTQRGFAKLLNRIGTPAAKCVARGRGAGRKAGDLQEKRAKQTVIFKTNKASKTADQPILLRSEETPRDSDPERIEIFLKSVLKTLGQINISPSEFTKRLLNPG